MHTARSLLCLFPLLLALLLGACSDGTVKAPQVDNNADPTGSDSDPVKDTGTPTGSDSASDLAGPVTSDSDDNPVTSDDDSDSDDAVDAVPCTEDNAAEVCGDDGFCADGYCCDAPCTGSCEVCNAPGSEGVCSPAPAETVCREAAGGCDVAETCDGASRFCPPNQVAEKGVVCRGAQDACEKDAVCDGKTQACPANEFAETGVSCGEEGACTEVGACDGAGNCDAAFKASGTVCGDASESDCDKPDTCDENGVCQPNHVALGESCSSDPDNDCLLAGECNGEGACVGHSFKSPGEPCGSQDDWTCDHPDTCGEDGACNPNYEPAENNTFCASSENDCELPGICDGLGGCASPGYQPDETPCGDKTTNTDCDKPDTCWLGVCEPNYVGLDTPCGNQTPEGDCDRPDQCDGQGNCDPRYLPANEVCRPAASGGCDVAEVCPGDSPHCPVDAFVEGGTECRAATGPCDVAELCTGTSAACPADAVAGTNKECGTPVAEFRCSSDDVCGAETQTRVIPNFCDGQGKTEAACKPDENTAWTTLATCDPVDEVCRATTTSAGCVACDDNMAPADYCGEGAEADLLYFYAGTFGECVDNECVGYTALTEDCAADGLPCKNGKCDDSYPCNAGNSTALPGTGATTVTVGGCYSYNTPHGRIQMMYTPGNATIVLRKCDNDKTIEEYLVSAGWTAPTVPKNCDNFLYIKAASQTNGTLTTAL